MMTPYEPISIFQDWTRTRSAPVVAKPPNIVIWEHGSFRNNATTKESKMPAQLFHPLLTVDEPYLRGRAESIDIELTNEQLVTVAHHLEQAFEAENIVSKIHEMAEELIRQASK